MKITIDISDTLSVSQLQKTLSSAGMPASRIVLRKVIEAIEAQRPLKVGEQVKWPESYFDHTWEIVAIDGDEAWIKRERGGDIKRATFTLSSLVRA